MEKSEKQEPKVIPSVSFNDNEIVVQTFDVPLIFNDEEAKITMKKLTAGEKRDLIKMNASVKLVGTQTNGTVDSVGYMIGLLNKVIVKAPFTVTEPVLSSLPEEVLEYLFAEYTERTTSKKKL